MQDYKMLAVRYLSMNKKRTFLTMAGVAVVVMVLFVLLNLGWSYVLHLRGQLREENDYEIVLLTESREQAEQIMADGRVKEAYLGSYYYHEYDEETRKIYPNAMYINTANPYRMDKIMEELKADYGVDGEDNEELAITYFNGGLANHVGILVLFLLFISYIFAILGVGVIRNSIQLSTLEQIRDYGNLRCIGASCGELKAFIYLEGAIMELGGIVAGVLLGTAVSVFAGYFMDMKAGFHFLPLIPIVIAFLFDLAFAMEENCKVVVNMSPLSALRGEYRIRKEKIRVKQNGLIHRLLGIEGDYAYKNIMRSPGRFIKTVSAIAIGIAALVAGGTILENVGAAAEATNDMYGYYQMWFWVHAGSSIDSESIRAALPPMENMEGLAKASGITDVKRLYHSPVLLTGEGISSHYTEQALVETGRSYFVEYQREHIGKRDENGDLNYELEMMHRTIECFGYDKEDFARYKDALVDGTLDVSDHGLILVNGARVSRPESLSDTYYTEYKDITWSDYKVGDTLDIVDMKRCREKITPLLAKWDREFDKVKEEAEQIDDEKKAGALYQNIYAKREKILYDCWQELIDEGAYETYTIEGIVDRDVNFRSEDMVFILPLESYFRLTGYGENDIKGMLYHVKRYPLNEDLQEYIYFDSGNANLFCEHSEYAEVMEQWKSMRIVVYLGIFFVLFIVSTSSFNIINTTASSLHLRKREFAQLRVIGISKRRLIKLVMMEGVITAVFANIPGILLGGGIGYLVSWYVYMGTGIAYKVPVLFILLALMLSFTLLCGSIYFPIRNLGEDMAGDLAAGGE